METAQPTTQAPATTTTTPAAGAPNGAAGASPPPTPSAAGGASAPAAATVDPTTASEVLRRAKIEKEARELRGKVKSLETSSGKAAKAAELAKKGDYLGALEALEVDPDDFYVKATDQINARTVQAKDPRAIARAEARAEIEERERQRLAEQDQQAVNGYAQAVTHVMRSEYEKFPHVARALAAGDLDRSDFHTLAVELANQGKDSNPRAVLEFINSHYGKEYGAPAAAAPTPAAAASAAPPSSLQSHAPVAREQVDDSDVDANYARAMAKLREASARK